MPDAQCEEELAKCRFRHLMCFPNPAFEKIAGFFHFWLNLTNNFSRAAVRA
jgi:hypothetical protein